MKEAALSVFESQVQLHPEVAGMTFERGPLPPHHFEFRHFLAGEGDFDPKDEKDRFLPFRLDFDGNHQDQDYQDHEFQGPSESLEVLIEFYLISVLLYSANSLDQNQQIEFEAH